MKEYELVRLHGIVEHFKRSDLLYQIICLEELDTIAQGYNLSHLREIKKSDAIVEKVLLLVKIEGEYYEDVIIPEPVKVLLNFYEHTSN